MNNFSYKLFREKKNHHFEDWIYINSLHHDRLKFDFDQNLFFLLKIYLEFIYFQILYFSKTSGFSPSIFKSFKSNYRFGPPLCFISLLYWFFFVIYISCSIYGNKIKNLLHFRVIIIIQINRHICCIWIILVIIKFKCNCQYIF